MSRLQLNDIPEEQLMAFYGLAFAAAAADNYMDKSELSIIYNTLDLSKLSRSNREKIHHWIKKPPDIDNLLHTLSESSEQLKLAVVVGIIEVMLADNVIVHEEQQLLNEVCEHFKISMERKNSVQTFVTERKRIIKEGFDYQTEIKELKKAKENLINSGVPMDEGIF
jgi:uncharacterized tellurite resistance protein B-like protein